MTLKSFRQTLIEKFQQNSFPTAALDVDLLLSHFYQCERTDLFSHYLNKISEDQRAQITKLAERRLKGEPIAYILGFKDFYKSRFIVNSSVLVPRPETELLVENAVEYLKKLERPSRIADWGSGSGCIGLSVLGEVANIHLEAFDISAEALAVTKENADYLQLSSRVTLIHCDISRYDFRAGYFDLIAANPPYLDADDTEIDRKSLNFEPSQALYSKDKGFWHLSSWSEIAAKALKPGGLLLMEIGAGQGAEIKKHLGDLNLVDVEILRDYAGHERIARAVK